MFAEFKMWSAGFVFLLLTLSAHAQPQRNQQQQQQQQQQKDQQKNVIYGGTTPPPSISLTEMTPELLQSFLRSDEDVQLLTECFVDFASCRSPHAIGVITQVRRLGIGGECPECTEEQQKNLHRMIYNFIDGFQTKYPAQWRKILPYLGTLIVGR